ncbi:hypothetical protein [Microlunatus parietis]|uniref:Uncharacterized protein n=1 Tax=Microlunatus parietis TaxID=682979 RepID=A0A7Y9I2J4_9ACTN|nr:hypothetical protein [Microlunatus parietis]NYE68811.1 hypothetical protein [Microlunatus parietis]
MNTTGPTRRRRRRPPKYRRLRPLDLWLLLIPVAIGIVLPVLWQIRPELAALVILLAPALGFGTVQLPTIAREILMWVLGFGVALAWGLQSPVLAVSWLVLFPCGFALGGHVRAIRSGVPKPGSVPVVPASDRMVCNPGEDEAEEVVIEPSLAAVLAAIDALDGIDRTVISLFRGPARLDLAGRPDGPMLVYHCADQTAARPEWSHLTTPGAPDVEVAIQLAVLGHFRLWQTTTLEPARKAVAEFLATGGRASGLSWRTDPDVTDLRPPGLDPD